MEECTFEPIIHEYNPATIHDVWNEFMSPEEYRIVFGG